MYTKFSFNQAKSKESRLGEHTDGKPTKPILASPVLATSKPSPFSPPPPFGVMSSLLYLANLNIIQTKN